jgi:plasmid stability protein
MQNTFIMPTLQIRDLPQDIYDRLIESAEKNRRSLTQEAVIILENVLVHEDSKTRKLNALKRLESMKHHFNGISTDDIVVMVREDRDR